jgi:hypothetical protein
MKLKRFTFSPFKSERTDLLMQIAQLYVAVSLGMYVAAKHMNSACLPYRHAGSRCWLKIPGA